MNPNILNEGTLEFHSFQYKDYFIKWKEKDFFFKAFLKFYFLF